ncbi:acyltransferase family protein [Demequina soli]|uniref:acyltransferase family protein n=1 Tax=Demequina soli TaxID=1638987 RepID=UPI0007816A29|nr:acyltransferase family protein [Demequina soli]
MAEMTQRAAPSTGTRTETEPDEQPERTRGPRRETRAAERFRPDIQGLRAVAILLVLLFHAGLTTLGGGYVGVDVFFVISGFLITGHIWRELRERGRIDFGQFYARRARRILPASFVVLAVTVVATWLWVAPLRVARDMAYAVATALYVPNVLLAAQGADYLADSAPPATQHYWSLGVEEQFYFIWPLGMVIAFWLARRHKRIFAALIGVVVVGSFALGVMLTVTNQPFAFFLLPTRAWELGAGGLLALAVAGGRARVPGWAAAVLGWAGAALILYAAFTFTETTPFPGWHAALPVGGAVLVILAGSLAPGHAWAPGRWLSVRWMVWIGAISYSLYLVHWPLLIIPQSAVGLENPLPLWVTLALGAAAVPLAWVMYRYVETPFRTMRRFTLARPRRTLFAALAASGVVALVAGLGFMAVGQKPLATADAAASVDISAAPIGTPFVPSNLTPGLASAAGDTPLVDSNGCHKGFGDADPTGCTVGSDPDAPTVAIFGDSHAAQWYPALSKLADDGDILFTSYTKAMCPAADIFVSRVPECGQWRDGVIDELAANPPDTIILSSYSTNYVREDADPVSAWADGVSAIIDRLPAESHVLIMADTPSGVEAVPICLSKNLSDAGECALAPVDTSLDVAASKLPGASGIIDMNGYLCDGDVCPAIIGDNLVYRDTNHISATFIERLAPELQGQL